MNWKFTDATNTVVFRVAPNGRTESCLVSTPEIQAWIALGNTPTPADPAPAPIDQADLDLISKHLRALALQMRTYTNQTRAGVTTSITLAALKSDFKTTFDSLP